MKLQKLTVIGLISGCFLLLSISSAAQNKSPITRSGDTIVSVISDASKTMITIRVAEITNLDSSFPLDRCSAPKVVTIISSLEISVDGQPLFVPRSVYADLIDPRNASICSVAGTFILTISGGDGADSYFVNVFYDSKQIHRRTLYSSLLPDSVAQDTRYLLHELKDEM